LAGGDTPGPGINAPGVVAGEGGPVPPTTATTNTVNGPNTTAEPAVAGQGGAIASTSASATLPRTGRSSSSGILQIGTLALSAGAGALLAARRRATEPAA